MMDVLLELADGLGGEGMGHCLAFASVFGSVTCVEETAFDGDKGVVVFADCTSGINSIGTILRRNAVLPFQKPIAMTVDLLDSICIRNRDMVRLYPNQFPILLMCSIHRQEPRSFPALPKKPEVGKLSWEWSWNAADGPVAYIWKEVVEDWEEDENVW